MPRQPCYLPEFNLVSSIKVLAGVDACLCNPEQQGQGVKSK